MRRNVFVYRFARLSIWLRYSPLSLSYLLSLDMHTVLFCSMRVDAQTWQAIAEQCLIYTNIDGQREREREPTRARVDQSDVANLDLVEPLPLLQLQRHQLAVCQSHSAHYLLIQPASYLAGWLPDRLSRSDDSYRVASNSIQTGKFQPANRYLVPVISIVECGLPHVTLAEPFEYWSIQANLGISLSRPHSPAAQLRRTRRAVQWYPCVLLGLRQLHLPGSFQDKRACTHSHPPERKYATATCRQARVTRLIL